MQEVCDDASYIDKHQIKIQSSFDLNDSRDQVQLLNA